LGDLRGRGLLGSGLLGGLLGALLRGLLSGLLGGLLGVLLERGCLLLGKGQFLTSKALSFVEPGSLTKRTSLDTVRFTSLKSSAVTNIEIINI
jgi:hypothetical protein